jgi:predicted nicotinamide N-methyase
MNIKDVLAGGVASLRNSKQQRILQNLRWRQLYQHCDHYLYDFHHQQDQQDQISLRLQQIPNGEIKGLGTGTFVWPAAHVLAKYFENAFGQGQLRDKSVCELGSGVGLTGVVTGLLGAAKVVLTDQEVILPLLAQNLRQLSDQLSADPQHAVLKERVDRIEVQEYDWSAEAPFREHFDLLVVSDCILPKLYPIDLLVKVLCR